jgi:hypothetical protein
MTENKEEWETKIQKDLLSLNNSTSEGAKKSRAADMIVYIMNEDAFCSNVSGRCGS